MKKYWVAIIISIAFFVLSATGIIVFGCLSVDENFYKVNLYEILSILLDLIVGILVALMILWLTFSSEHQRNKKEAVIKYLSKMEDKIEEIESSIKSNNLKMLWNNALITKSSIEATIRFIKESSLLKKSEKEHLASIENQARSYFLYIQDNFYTKAVMTEIIKAEERNRREMLKTRIAKMILFIS